MKKIFLLCGELLAAGGLIFTGGAAIPTRAAEEIGVNCKAAYLCDYDSGTAVYQKEETKRLPIASMCKIMTLILSFEAVDEGNLTYEEQITVSDHASGMGGSQVFLGANLSYPASELMKSVAVCSANDSCVALAERISGTESAFVEKMNERAKELGAENTLFANCTGLPKEPQYSCAKDVSIMLRELLTHRKYFEFSKVWLEDFAHPDGRTTQMTNTNKLLRYYDGCDGGKTGFTSDAGFCLAATAKRGQTRLISVVIGAGDSKTRFSDVSNLFNYAFNTYENKPLIKAGEELEEKINVRGSRQEKIGVCAENTLSAFIRKGKGENLDVEMNLPEEVKAPVAQGDVIGEAILYRDGVELARTNLIAAEDVKRFSWWDAVRESARNWN